MKNFKVILIIFFISAMIYPNFIFADNKQKIGELGDKAWNDLAAQYKSEDKYMELTNSSELIKHIKKYNGELMVFPKLNFDDFVIDRNTNKYYYYGNKSSTNYFVMKYNEEINMKLYRMNNVYGNLNGQYEVMGTIKDAYTWWGNVVLIDIKAIRIPGKFCLVVENNNVKIIAEELIQLEIKQKQKDGNKDKPN